MKKLLTMLLLMSLFGLLLAQDLPEHTVRIGTGTSSGYSSNPLVNTSNDYSYSQNIYLQSEINIANQCITKIWYQWNGATNGATNKDFEIYMGHTTRSSFSTAGTATAPIYNINPTDLQLVFSGEVYITNTPMWVEFSLETPFVYNNIDNLVIAVNEVTPSRAQSGGFLFTSAGAGNNRGHIRFKNDTAAFPGPWDVNTVGTLSVAGSGISVRTSYANILMLFEEVPEGPIFRASPNSHNFGITSLTTSATQEFSFRNAGIGTLSITNIAITGTHQAQFNLTNTNTIPADLTTGQNITVSVTYYPLVSGEHSANLTVVANGETYNIPLSGQCYAITTFPHYENFDAVTAPNLPTGWEAIIRTNLTGHELATSTTSPQSAPNNVIMNNGTGTMGADQFFALRSPFVENMPQRNVSFAYRGATTGHSLEIGVMSDLTDPDTYTMLHTLTNLPTTYTATPLPLTLASATENDHFIVFKHGDGGTGRTIYIDDIQIGTVTNEPGYYSATTIIDFGPVSPGSPATQSVSIGNIGGATLLLSDFVLPPEITRSPNTATISIAPGTTQTIQFTLTTTTAGIYDQPIIFSTNDPQHLMISIPTTAVSTYIHQIGDSSLNNINVPINPHYSYNYSQTIYLANDLTTLAPGSVLNSLAFQYNRQTADNASTWDYWTIYIAHTTQSSFSNASNLVDHNSLTQVFSGQLILPTVSGQWTTVHFDEPFTYDGVSNLLVAIYEDVPGSTTSAFNIGRFRGSSSGSIARSVLRASNEEMTPDNALSSSYSITNTVYPNIRIGYIPGTPISGPYYYCETTHIDFGDVMPVTPVTMSIMVKNPGSETLTLTDIVLPPNLSITPADSSITIGSRQFREIQFTLNMPTTGIYDEIITFSTNDPTNPTVTIDVSALCYRILTIPNTTNPALTNNQFVPIYTHYSYNYSQMIYLRDSDLVPTTTGLPRLLPGATINNLALRYNPAEDDDGHTWNNWTIFLGHTTKTSFANTNDLEDPSSLTQVFTGQITLPQANEWMIIYFDEPFIYDGWSNLVVAIYENAPGKTYISSNVGRFSAFATTTTTRHIARYQDIEMTPEEAVNSTYSASFNGYPYIRFGYEAGTEISGPAYRCATTEFDYGIVTPNVQAQRSITIRNLGTGTTALSLTNFYLPPNIARTPTTSTINSGTVLTINFNLTMPITTTTLNDTISFETNDPLNPIIKIPVRATTEIDDTFLLWTENNTQAQNAPAVFGQRHSYSQTIYTAEQLGEAKIITSIAFHMGTASANANLPLMGDWKIWINHTTASNFGTTTAGIGWVNQNFPNGNWLLAYDYNVDGKIDFSGPNAPRWININLSTPFEYNGEDNVVIAIMSRTDAATGATERWSRSASTESRSRIHTTNGSGESAATPFPPHYESVLQLDTMLPTLTASFNVNFYPNIRIGYTTELPPPHPTNLNGSPASYFVDISWTRVTMPRERNLSFLEYVIYRDDEEIGTVTNINSSNYTDTTVESDYTYVYHITARYLKEGEVVESRPSEKVAMTTQRAILPPPTQLEISTANQRANLTWTRGEEVYYEGFDTSTLSTDWTISDEDGDGQNWTLTSLNSPIEGKGMILSHSRNISNGTPVAPENWLISPQLSIAANSYLNFWIGATDSTACEERYEVRFSTTPTPSSTWTLLHSETLTSSEWQRKSIRFNNPITIAYIAFIHTGSTNQSALKLDGVQIVHANTTPISDGDHIGYTIYRNNALLFDLDNAGANSYADNSIVQNGIYTYWLKAKYNIPDIGIKTSSPGNAVAIVVDWVSEEEITEIALTTLLGGNYPNPFNPNTTIHFTVGGKNHSPVQIDIYNIKGQKVRSLVDGIYPTGQHSIVWNGTDSHGRAVSSGVYFYRMKTNDFVATKKMLLMK